MAFKNLKVIVFINKENTFNFALIFFLVYLLPRLAHNMSLMTLLLSRVGATVQNLMLLQNS